MSTIAIASSPVQLITNPGGLHGHQVTFAVILPATVLTDLPECTSGQGQALSKPVRDSFLSEHSI